MSHLRTNVRHLRHYARHLRCSIRDLRHYVRHLRHFIAISEAFCGFTAAKCPISGKSVQNMDTPIVHKWSTCRWGPSLRAGCGSEGRSPPVEAIVSSLGGEGACRALPMAGWKSTIQQVWKTAPLAAGVQLRSLGQAETIGLCVSVFARVARKQNARSQPDRGRLKR